MQRLVDARHLVAALLFLVTALLFLVTALPFLIAALLFLATATLFLVATPLFLGDRPAVFWRYWPAPSFRATEDVFEKSKCNWHLRRSFNSATYSML